MSVTDIDWERFDAQRLALEENEFLDRLSAAIDELPDPPLWFRIQFLIGDCAWRVRRLFHH